MPNSLPDRLGESASQGSRILLVEDEEALRSVLAFQLERAGYGCESCATIAEARRLLAAATFDLVLLDIRLPDGSGLDLVQEAREQGEAAVVIMTSFPEVSDAVQAVKRGADDYLPKPESREEMVAVIERALARATAARRLDYARARADHAQRPEEFLGSSAAAVRIRREIQRIGRVLAAARGHPPTVLLLGETGVGKDLVARLIHAAAGDPASPMVQVECAALPASLIEAELFGHEKGAFTEARQDRIGLIEAAEDGTVFLNEIGEIPLDLQVKLLSVLDRRLVRRLGSNRERPIRARFIAATNRDLRRMVQEGSFREDLYFRLEVLSLELPPLRERREDVALLVEHFARTTAQRHGLEPPEFTAAALAAMEAYSWPGNTRELHHVVERAVLLQPGGRVQVEDLGLRGAGGPGRPGSPASPGGGTLDEILRRALEEALGEAEGNISEAARRLGIGRGRLRSLLRRYGPGRSGPV